MGRSMALALVQKQLRISGAILCLTSATKYEVINGQVLGVECSDLLTHFVVSAPLRCGLGRPGRDRWKRRPGDDRHLTETSTMKGKSDE